MKLPATTVLDIELAGCLHDVGMIGRQKPARSHSATVSKREHEHFRRHAIAGAAFVGNVASLAYLAPIVRSHHERFDGHGYPDGLRGDEIPLPSRIISVAGAFVDLVTPSSQFETKLRMTPAANSLYAPARSSTPTSSPLLYTSFAIASAHIDRPNFSSCPTVKHAACASPASEPGQPLFVMLRRSSKPSTK